MESKSCHLTAILVSPVPKRRIGTRTPSVIAPHSGLAPNNIRAAPVGNDTRFRIPIVVGLHPRIAPARRTTVRFRTFVLSQSMLEGRLHAEYLSTISGTEHHNPLSSLIVKGTKKPVSLVRDRLLATVTTLPYPRVTAKRNWPRFSQKKKPVINIIERWMDCKIFCINVFPKYQTRRAMSNTFYK